MKEITLLEPRSPTPSRRSKAATDLPASKRVHRACSLRQICGYLDKSAGDGPARWKAIYIAVHSLHAARVVANPKTLANHKANARAALVWFANARTICRSRALR